MELPINKDPQELNKSAFEGRKWWQYLCIISAVIISVVFTLVFQEKLGSSLNSIICAVLVIPLGYVGIFKKNGLDFIEYTRKKYGRTGKVYLYVSEPVKGHMETDNNSKKRLNNRLSNSLFFCGGKHG